ncbi:hypothetical protein MLD38_032788 [Melastoma candidum]|uniref:Uncharacterized protein n=1 Tax=Melastoma candidum TaxID=119954 RepID=A0ACB9M4F1_9MYRT|nr:hypothetical protein MLD38_032788 [Melastoma candidum]
MEMEKEKSFQQESLGVVPDWNHLMGLLQSGRAQPHPHMQFHFPHVPVTDQPIAIMHGEEANGVPAAPTVAFPSSKPRWGSCETLESVVRQATCRNVPRVRPEDSRAHIRDCTGHTKVAKSLAPRHPPQVASKRTRCESEPGVWRKKKTLRSSVSNARENNFNTIMATKLDKEESFSEDDSENKEEEGKAARGETRLGTSQTQCPRQDKATATHNLSEQRRRDRINEKMKALQKLVPNSNKTDKASMLDEVIAYTKQLQAQVEAMKLMRSSSTSNNNSRSNNHVNVPQMMNAMTMMMPPTALPHHQLLLQMSLLARMGAGLGLGMLDYASNATANIPFPPPQQPPLPPHFLMPQMIPTGTFTTGQLNPNIRGASSSMPMHDPYATFLAQMRMDDYYNKLASLHRQHIRHHARSDKTQRQ